MASVFMTDKRIEHNSCSSKGILPKLLFTPFGDDGRDKEDHLWQTCMVGHNNIVHHEECNFLEMRSDHILSI